MRERVKITDYLFFQEGPGVRNTQYTTSGVKLLNVSNLVDGEIDLSNSDRYISNEEAYGKYKHFLVDEGDLIIASSGIKVDYLDKKIGFIKKEHLPLCMNTSTIRFKALDGKALNIKYFKYYLQSNDFKYQVSKNITGSAQLNYGPSHLKQMTFILYDLDEQNEIVERLDRINNLIQKHKEVINNLDTLIKARFVEMFGDLNNTKYDIKTIEECAIFVKDGTHNTPMYTEDKVNGFKFLSSKDVTSGKIDWSNIKYIPKELHNELYERIKPQKNDILLAKNGTTGICAIVDNDEIFDIYVSLALIRLKEDLNPTYIWTIINSYMVKEQFNKSLKGIGVPNLHLSEIKKVKLIVPPIGLQNSFAAFVKEVDKLKVA